MGEKTFADQNVVVTGGGTGIGRAAALAFAEQGAASVLVTGRRPEPLAEVAAEHPAITAVVADVATEEGAEAIAEAVRERGRLDVLVHNAGVWAPTPLDALDPAEVRRQFEINVVGPTLLTARLLPLLRSPGGNIVVVSSISARLAGPGASVYSATKAAVDSLIRSWAVELGPKGIRVNGVAPGNVRTSILAIGGLANTEIDTFRTTYADRVPAGRIGEVDDVVPWITRLAEPASSWITGEIITMDGGRLAA
ncbi:SDR family NAD(P)-dependent oxidoreductase [Nocardia arthritidis]|uniref:SDR family NAD(P)-dependent oxidoreductase n=1 Tax=Nocardia arthritidis TaxID=228602 RepID=UPI00142DE31E|nr:SDR family oxidoreductase [Nocardia arthritidis]